MSKEPRAIESIQILRAIAALSVLIAHFHHDLVETPGGYNLGIGGLGVDLFFVISGFIMVHTCWPTFGNTNASVNFMLRRLARIVPLYWSASLIVLLCIFYTQPISRADLSMESILCSFIFYPSQNPSGSVTTLLSVGWTLNYEMLFYAVFCVALNFRRHIALWITFGALLTIALGRNLLRFDAWEYWSSSIVMEFAIGMLVAIVYRYDVKINKQFTVVSIISGLSICVINYLTSFSAVTRGYICGAGMGLVVAGATLYTWNLKSKISFGLKKIGDCSFSIYVLHPLLLWPHIILGLHSISIPYRGIGYATLLFLLTIAISYYTYSYLERPITGMLNKIIHKAYPLNSEACVNRSIVSDKKVIEHKKISQFNLRYILLFPLAILCVYSAYVVTFQVSDSIEHQQDESMVNLVKARSYSAAGNHEEAIAYYTSAININQNIGMPGLIHVERGMAYEALSKYKDAYDDYTLAIQINADKYFLLRRIQVAKILNDYTTVEGDTRKLRECCADDPEVIQAIGSIAQSS